ncbi:MAG: ABC transporter permease [Jiangellales bacterium]
MTGWRHVYLVARRDFVARARSRAFLLTMVFAVGVVAVGGLFVASTAQPDPTRDVGVLGEQSATFTAALAAAAEQVELEPTLVEVPDRAVAEQGLADGALDVVVVTQPDPGALIWESGPDPQVATMLAVALQADQQQRAAEALGLSEPQAASLVAPASPASDVLDPPDPAEGGQQGAVFVGMLLLYLAVILFGQLVMMAVVEEKSSRVVEVLLSRVLPYRLLAGKVLGVGALAVIQVSVLAGASYLVATQVLPDDIEIDLGPGLLGSIVGWFLLGFAFFAVLYAALGSTVTRQEDVQSVALIPMFFILPAYFIAILAGTDPDSTLTRVTSILPPFSPFVMPVRSAVTDVPAWEIGLSVALLMAATYGMIRLAGRIYTGAILSIGQKVSLRQAWRSSSHVPTE